jgi:hypothetical protein
MGLTRQQRVSGVCYDVARFTLRERLRVLGWLLFRWWDD